MTTEYPQITPMGERAVLIEFEPEIQVEILQKVLFYKKNIQEFYVEVKVDIISAYNSLLIIYPFTINNVYAEISRLESILEDAKIPEKLDAQLFHIPVCYEAEFAPDLPKISSTKNIEIPKLIALHAQTIYTVYFIGFLPGFLYLGGLDKMLHFPRKKEPEMKLRKGAVGIGGSQTGIYPQESPGGWNIIGNSPVELFNKNANPPCAISAGDKIKFYSISKKEYQEISLEVEKGSFRFKKQKYAD